MIILPYFTTSNKKLRLNLKRMNSIKLHVKVSTSSKYFTLKNTES